MAPADGLDDAERQELVRLALADWSPAAGARVDSVVVSTSRAAVNRLVNADYAYCVLFRRDDHGRWQESASSTGRADRADLDVLD